MNKINFVGIISAAHCNPNGDPLLGNRPRTDYNGYVVIDGQAPVGVQHL